MLRILKIDFKDMTCTIRSLFLCFHLKMDSRLTHCPSVEIVCIVVHGVVIFFSWVIIHGMRIVGFCMPF